jgi:hypothetical protein
MDLAPLVAAIGRPTNGDWEYQLILTNTNARPRLLRT